MAGVVQGLARETHASLLGVTRPCTLVWGGLDHSHKLTNPLSLRDAVPHANVVQFDDCGHFPDIEQPARFADLVFRLVL